MVFKVIKPFIADTGKTYNAPIVKKYVNAYGVRMGEDICIVMKSDICVLSMTEEEKAIKVEF